MPIMVGSPSGETSVVPRAGTWPMVPRARGPLIATLGQQGVPLGHRGCDIDDRPVAAAGVLAQPVEGLAVAHVVALHEDALGALDQRPALERRLQALHLLDELA